MAEKLVATITVQDNGGGGTYKKPQSAGMTLDCGISVLGNYLDVSDVLASIVDTYSVGKWTKRADNMSHTQQIPADHVWPLLSAEPYLKADIKAAMTFQLQYSVGGVNTVLKDTSLRMPCPKKSMIEDTPDGLRVTKTAGDAIAALLQGKLDGYISGVKVTFVKGYLEGKQ